MEKEPPVVVARTWTDSEAAVIKSLLEGYDIPCHYSSELPHRMYTGPMDSSAQIRIFVPAELADDALRILEDHRRHDGTLHLVD